MSSRLLTTIGTLFFLCQPALATIDCGPYEVLAIQSQQSNVLISLKSGNSTLWKRLADHSSPFVYSYQALAQQVMAVDGRVVLRYPDGADCAATDYHQIPLMIRALR